LAYHIHNIATSPGIACVSKLTDLHQSYGYEPIENVTNQQQMEVGTDE